MNIIVINSNNYKKKFQKIKKIPIIFDELKYKILKIYY